MSPTPLIYRCATAISRLSTRTHILPLSILLGALLFGVASTATATSDDGNDREALVALYNATDGPNWRNNTNWLSDKPVGEWYGVYTDASGRVTRLLLDFNRLSGALPSELGNLTNLTELSLWGNGITDISSLSGLTNLTDLNLRETRVTDISSLSDLTNLTDLNLRETRVTDISSLSDLTNLTVLNLSETRVTDFSSLAGLTNLKSLDLKEIRGSLTSGAEQRSPLDLSSLAGLTSLTQLNLSLNKISDLSPLASLANLKALNLSAVHIRWDESDTSTLDLSPLADLTDLTDLDIHYNNVTDISPLAGLINLTRLDIRKNHIADVSPLAGLTKLAYLNAQENEIANVSPLSGLTALQELVLSNNLISDISPLVENAGLGRGDVVDVRANPLNAESTSTHIPALLARGVDVSFDDVVVFTESQVYNGNVFVMPVTENLAAGNLPRKDYTSRFYEYFNDEFDFLMFVPNLAPGQHEPGVVVGAYYLGVKNDVRGIGKSVFANNGEWGSAGRLQGVIDFGGYSIYHDRGLSILADGPTLHELMHRWANFVVPSIDYPHWGFSSANGNMGGFDIADLMHHGGNRYSAGHFTVSGLADNVEPYGAIELYLAGFLPPEDVPDLWVAEDGAWLYDESGDPVFAENGHPIFTASQVRTYTIEDVIAEHGARVPDVSQAQKDFRAAVILLVDENHPATRDVLETLSDDVSWFSHADDDETHRYNFYEATGGRATITMGGLSEFLKDSPSNTPSDSAASDRVVLTALYNATDGDNWRDNTNWLSDEPLGNWHGVTTDADGRVATLDLTENWLSGRMPSQLGDLSSLGELRLANNHLSGPIPPELGSLSALTRLDLENNDLSGSIPSQLGDMSDIRVLLLGDNNLSGRVPAQLGNLGKLSYLRIRNNDLTGPIPPDLGRLENLTHLYANDNDFVGSIPSELGNMSNLRYLFLNDNDLSGSIPAALGDLEKLAYLWLNHNDLTGPIPAELGDLPNLVRLYINHNNLSGAIPSELGGLDKLELLYVHRNNLSGAIPPELGDLANLKRLYAYDNDLSGAIPIELGGLTKLERLHIAENDLGGSIPSELGGMSNLSHLILSLNDLTGGIPPNLGGLSNLQVLSMSNNELSGVIPAELGDLSALIQLYIANNYLEGCIPAKLRDVPSNDLDSLGLSDCVSSPIAVQAPKSPPPTWIFTGGISEEHQTTLRDEMEAVRTWFSNQYSVESTDFTVAVGTDAETLASKLRDTLGLDLSNIYVPPGYSGPYSQLPDPFVTTADDGRPVMVLIYESNPFDRLKHVIAHEYFHVLQAQLLASRYHTSEVEPYWLVEGTAQYADHAYSQSRPGRRPFLGDRSTPYEDLEDAINLKRATTPRYLENIADVSNFRDGCALHPIYVYAFAFAGAHFLVGEAGEDSVVEFWKLLAQRPTWQQAFKEAFGMGIEDFYDSFAEWLPDQLPSFVELSVWLHWPGKEALSPEVLNRLRWNTAVSPEDVTAWPSSGGILSGGSTVEGAHTISWPAGESWTGGLGLWYQTDQCTDHFLGWYKDGELTDQHAEATVLQFSGESSNLDWTIPASPDTLPRLREIRLGHCN